MTFNGPALDGAVLDVRDAGSGDLIDQVAVPGPIWSGTASVGDALVLGVGDSYTAEPSGVVVITPGGRPPVVPTAGYGGRLTAVA